MPGLWLLLLLLLPGCGGQPDQEKGKKTPPPPAAPVSDLQAGDEFIDMNAEAQARQLLLAGWSSTFDGQPGEQYLWAVAKKSGFRLFVTEPELGGTLSLLAFPFPVKNGPGQGMAVSVNGKPVGKVTMEPREKEYIFAVPPAALKKGENQFELTFDYCESPRKLGTGEDSRTLAALFKKISFAAHEPVVTKASPQPGDLSLDMNLEAKARVLLLEGWSDTMEGAAGDRYIWGLGKRSAFQLYVETVGRGGVLNFRACPFQAPGLPKQTIAVSVNAKPAGSVTLEGLERNYTLKIPGAAIQKGVNRFQFSYAYSESPQKLDRGADSRSLAVLFKRISFVPERDLQPGDNYIDFNREADARVMLQEGWSEMIEGEANSRYLWTTGKRAAFRLFVENPGAGGSLAFMAFPFPAKGLPRQSVDTYVNSRLLGKIVLDPAEKMYSLKVPPESLKQGVNRFEFTFAYTVIPSKLGMGSDERALAVLFKRIYFVAD